MNEIVAVLVVPFEGDLAGLMEPGRCGPEEPASAGRYGGQWESPAPGGWGYMDRCLPVWWGGELVPEGWDRATRLLNRATRGGYAGDPETAEDARARGLALVRVGLAARVVCIAKVDGQLVEVTT